MSASSIRLRPSSSPPQPATASPLPRSFHLLQPQPPPPLVGAGSQLGSTGYSPSQWGYVDGWRHLIGTIHTRGMPWS
ncbi:hypothetical protein BKA70DRAFT_1430770 [Coprinopsis sp. MPI-PUGE-AT-0042]|nr:hypothetical protein BKA70DRAFT_1430770 [Coprinopsis sp. MPI-PUGE-AT-0042]